MRRVVVTGLGCISPVGNDIATFWDSLVAGKHGFAEITKFDVIEMKAKIAAEVKDFDPTKYIERSEVKRTELYCQYAIAAAQEAMDDSGLSGTVDAERFGVYVGSGIGGLGTMLAQTEIMFNRGPERLSPFLIPMMIANMASGLVAMRFNARGPNLPVISACATATHAIGEAFRAIKHGYADAILTGGSEASINKLGIGAFTTAMALSTATDPNRASIPFDRERNGFIMGEGAGVLVLEEYDRAVARGAKIYCEIIGYGNTCDAHHITAPREDASETSRMIRQAFEEAGIAPDHRLYINAHGTSTPPNDKAETLAIKKALGEEIAYKIPVSSTKSMTGHMLGAAGAIEAIASIKAIETGIVPPTVGYSVPDPDCDLDYVPNQARKCNIDKALSLSLGFGGHNAGVLFRAIDKSN